MNTTLAASVGRDLNKIGPRFSLFHLHRYLTLGPCLLGVCIIFIVSSQKAIVCPLFPYSWGHHSHCYVRLQIPLQMCHVLFSSITTRVAGYTLPILPHTLGFTGNIS